MDETQKVIKRYAEKYPRWSEVKVMQRRARVAGGALAVVQAKDEKRVAVEEICFIDGKGDVHIYDTSLELVSYLESGSALRTWIFTGQGVSAIAFLMTLAAVVAFTAIPGADHNAEGFKVLTQVLLIAAGFFFGNQLHRRA